MGLNLLCPYFYFCLHSCRSCCAVQLGNSVRIVEKMQLNSLPHTCTNSYHEPKTELKQTHIQKLHPLTATHNYRLLIWRRPEGQNVIRINSDIHMESECATHVSYFQVYLQWSASHDTHLCALLFPFIFHFFLFPNLPTNPTCAIIFFIPFTIWIVKTLPKGH